MKYRYYKYSFNLRLTDTVITIYLRYNQKTGLVEKYLFNNSWIRIGIHPYFHEENSFCEEISEEQFKLEIVL